MKKTLAYLAVAVVELTTSTMAPKASVEEIRPSVVQLSGWKSEAEASLATVTKDMGELRQQVAQIATNPILKVRPHELPGLMSTPPNLSALVLPLSSSALLVGAKKVCDPNASSSVLDTAPGLDGHRYDYKIQGLGTGDPPPLDPTLGKGTNLSPGSPLDLKVASDGGIRFGGGIHSMLPHMDFPVFDGGNPTSWQYKCEAYFRVYGVSPEYWVSLASMNLTSSAALWFQSQPHLYHADWGGFVEAVCYKFGRGEFQQVLRQFTGLKLLGIVV
ncbi:hypothetical protein PR202_ga22910 [Eleusine coracana subsp. coracana]|uniref:Uncharacterized protein n=1 Tax=Eleusine coracana subsp. coracana TaxID=191504 RepID=A0AAV5D593_ELECO|nr:hypothetical protein PR202_ga22910 [Eleusine coracana subsp. coracana]